MIEVYYLKSQTYKICRIALIAVFFGLWCWLKILTQVPFCMVPNGGNPPKVVSSWSTKSNNSYGLWVNLVTLFTTKNDPTYNHPHIATKPYAKKTLLSLWLWHDCFPKQKATPLLWFDLSIPTALSTFLVSEAAGRVSPLCNLRMLYVGERGGVVLVIKGQVGRMKVLW